MDPNVRALMDIHEEVKECLRRAPTVINTHSATALIDRLERIERDIDTLVTEVTEVTPNENRH